MPKRLELGVVLLAIVILFGFVTLSFWGFVRDTLVVPLYYTIWVGGLVLGSIPQAVWLYLLVGICLWIGLGALATLHHEAAPQRQERAMLAGKSRYRSWRDLCRSSASSGLARRDLHLEVRHLVLAVLACQEGVDLAEAEQMVAGEKVVVPEGVRSLIGSKDISAPGTSVKRMDSVERTVRSWFRQPAWPLVPIQDEQISESLEFLEAQLEMPHE